MPRTMKTSEFEQDFQRLVDELAASGEPVVLTKDGEPVAEIVPFRKPRKPLFGAMKGEIQSLGDIVEPIDVDWDAIK